MDKASRMTPELQHYFDVINSEQKAYLFGFICADGYVSKDGKQIEIRLSQKDREHLIKMSEIFNVGIKNTSYYDIRYNKTYKQVRIRLCSTVMVDALRRKGLDNNKTFSLNSKVFSHVPPKYYNHFVRGYFDGDGSIAFTKGRAECVSFCGTEDFLTGLQRIICINSGIGRSKIYAQRGHCAVYFRGPRQLLKFRDWLYKNAHFYMTRKKDRFSLLDSYFDTKTSQYFGVYWHKASGKWMARAQKNKKTFYLGLFSTEKSAACAYDKKISELGLPNYKYNFIPTVVSKRD